MDQYRKYLDVRRLAADNEICAEEKMMKDKTRKYAKMFSKAMKKLGRSDYKRLEHVFYQRYNAHLNSEMYQIYRPDNCIRDSVFLEKSEKRVRGSTPYSCKGRLLCSHQ